MQNKKAQTNLSMVMGAVGVVILLVAIGIIYASSFKAVNTMQALAENTATSATNETITWGGNNTPISIKRGSTFGLASDPIVYNNGSKIAQGAGANSNYTFNTDDGTLTIVNSTPGTGNAKGTGMGTWVTNKINVTVSIYIGSQELNTTLLTKEGMKVMSDFQPTWATIAAVGILITALLIPLIIWIMGKL